LCFADFSSAMFRAGSYRKARWLPIGIPPMRDFARLPPSTEDPIGWAPNMP